MFRWSLTLMLLASFVALVACGGGYSTPAVEPPKVDPVDVGFVPVASLELDVRRRAFQHLEEMRGSEMAPTWEEVTFSDQARKLYRPDVEGVAYFEIEVIPADEGVGPPCGHVILSTGMHDVPIPHWDYEGPSITSQLAERARDAGKQAVRFYKLDALSYAAEDAEGEKVATVGTELARVEGLDPAWLEDTADPTEAIWTPDRSTTDDADAGGIDGKEEISGPMPPPELILGGWSSWADLKSGYRAAYGVLAESLRRLAAPDWEADALARQNGEGLRKGDEVRLSLMQEDAPPYKVEGVGADPQYLDVHLETRPGRPAVLVLSVLDAVQVLELPFTVEIQYAAETEVRKFGIVGPTMITEDLLKYGTGTEQKASEGRPTGAPRLAWGPWNFFWAGGDERQPYYYQISPGDPPNTASCVSGCGATAWAMLFGWADSQAASGNTYWAPRWGLYRTGGGTGANAVAPRTQSEGVENMTWEIRGHIGTFCAFGSGATWPWDMWKAAYYLRNRTGTQLEARCNTLGNHKDDLRDMARDSIIHRNTPAVIGTGWLNHYPLAYAYAFRVRTVRDCNLFGCWHDTEVSRWFKVNQGWGGEGNGWVGAYTFLYGSIRP